MLLIINGTQLLHARLRDFGIIATWRNDGGGEIDIEVSSAIELIRIGEILEMLGYE